MQIKSLKEFERLIEICKKHGVEQIEVGSIKMTVPKTEARAADDSDKVATPDALTEEEIHYWSVNGAQ